MSQTTSNSVELKQRANKRELVPSSVAGMLIFVMAEAMFFAALFSSYRIVSAGVPDWPPLDQPRLPVLSTAFNSLALLLSAWTIFQANRRFTSQNVQVAATRRFLLATILLGSFFILFQGFEWLRLIKYGLTMTSSSYGSFFYLLIGTHALHAVAALCVLYYNYFKLRRNNMSKEQFWGAQVFWYFVVGVWPILYVLVYLS
ncbi:MAG: heme-copper oxidase subunit III [Verrucomicrobia bacterium]|nr:heme-copper oxidase subunit III [Verrucomicrobiota bacterium]